MHTSTEREHRGVLAGLTTRVAFGSLWGFSGQWVALLASLVATPFVIRQLGTDAYGVLGLVNVLMGYMVATGTGLGQASTRFAANAHGEHDTHLEAAVVWTSFVVMTVIAGATALLFVLAAPVIVERGFRTADSLTRPFVTSLQIVALSFVARSLAGVLATPHTVRLRLGLVALIDGGCAALQIALIPVALWLFGSNLVVAVAVGALMNVLAVVLHAGVALRLQPSLSRPSFSAALVGPLLRFSLSTSFMSVTGLILLNVEKVVLVRLDSPAALAYYAVAFTVGRLLVVLPVSTARSLLPAFSQLHPDRDRATMQSLYSRAQRGLFLSTVPAAVVIGSVAAPFLSVWAGPEYGRESVLPLYILILGCAADGLSYVPRALLSAVGRPDLVARVHALALAPYVAVAAALVLLWGSAGAATAWTLRALVECVTMMILARRTTGVTLRFLPAAARGYLTLLLVVLLPTWFLALTWGFTTAGLAIGAVILALHALVAWTRMLTSGERQWAAEVIRSSRV